MSDKKQKICSLNTQNPPRKTYSRTVPAKPQSSSNDDVKEVFKHVVKEETKPLMTVLTTLESQVSTTRKDIQQLKGELIELKLTTLQLLEFMSSYINRLEHPEDNMGDTGGFKPKNMSYVEFLKSRRESVESMFSEYDDLSLSKEVDSIRLLRDIFSERDFNPEDAKDLFPRNRSDGIFASESGSYFLGDHSDIFAAPKRVLMYLALSNPKRSLKVPGDPSHS